LNDPSSDSCKDSGYAGSKNGEKNVSEDNSQRLAEAGVTLDDEGRPDGFGVGKEAAMREWLHRKEVREFKKLCRQLWQRNYRRLHRERFSKQQQARWDKLPEEQKAAKRKLDRARHKEWWANLDPKKKAVINEYKTQWGRENREKSNASSRRSKRRRRANPGHRTAENEERRRKRAVETEKRRATTVYECRICLSRWSPVGPIPRRAPMFCSDTCKNKHHYFKKKALGLCQNCGKPVGPERAGRNRCNNCKEGRRK